MASLRQTIRRIAAYLGISVERSIDQFAVQRLILPTDQPVIVDIGAFDGTVVRKYRRHFPGATIYAIEPCRDEYERLRWLAKSDPLVIPVNKAVAQDVGERILHVNRYHQTNSLYLPDPDASKYWQEGTYQNSDRTVVESTTLDAFADEEKLKRIDILKIDAQGAELEILKGASRLLSQGQIDLVYLEVITCPTYVGQGSLPDIVALLTMHDYRLWDIYDCVRGHGKKRGWIPRLLQADVLFVSNRSQLLSSHA